MAGEEIFSNNIPSNIAKAFNINPQDAPSKLGTEIIPVFVANQPVNPSVNVVSTITSPGTLFTTPTGGNTFYLTFMSVGLSDAIGGGYLQILGYVGGVQQTLSSVAYAGVSKSLYVPISISPAVLIDAGTSITFVDTSNNGINRTATILGYTYNNNIYNIA